MKLIFETLEDPMIFLKIKIIYAMMLYMLAKGMWFFKI